jgi:DNA polymerase elongation subunit (family B)
MIIDIYGRDNLYTIDLHHNRKEWEYLHEIYVHGPRLEKISDELGGISWIKIEEKYMRDIYGEKKVLSILTRPSKIKTIIEAIESIGRKYQYQIYNADIDTLQAFLVKNNLELFSNNIDELEELEVLEIGFQNGLEEIEINGETFHNVSIAIDEFFHLIKNSNVIVSNHGDTFFPKFFGIARKYGYETYYRITKERSFESYGRVVHRKNGFIIEGIPHIDASTSFMYSEGGLIGLSLLSNFISIPIWKLARITPGTAVSSYEVKKSLEMGVMIPLYKWDHEEPKDIDTFIEADRGGLILQPKPGVYWDVYEIDFSSMYPSIIVFYNLSPETVNGKCQEFEIIESLGFKICKHREGYLSKFLRDLLLHRLEIKKIKKVDSRFEGVDAVFKWLLLTSFGYTGYKNAKFGKIEVHEAVTGIGREILQKSIQIATDEGFKVIHGIVDSLWLSGNGDINSVIERIERETRLQIALEGKYKWIVFLPSREGIGALNRYFGLMYGGKMKIRGIDARRSDVPNICKRMQEDVLGLYSSINSREDFSRIKEEALAIYEKYLEIIQMGRATDEDLTVNFVATRYPEFYLNSNVRKSALMKNTEAKPGDKISFIVINEKSKTVSVMDSIGYDIGFYTRKLRSSWEQISFPLKDNLYQMLLENYDRN